METVVDDVRLYWRESGEGPAVLFVHGFPFHGGMWDDQLERLPGRWRWLAPDLRGFGRSESSADEDSPLAMDLFADDLAAFLDARDVERAVVCGLSMGGYVSFALWNWHPERVAALVLCDTRAGADTEEKRRGRRELATRVGREGASAAADALLPKLLSDETRRARPEVVDAVRSMIESTPPATIVRALEGMARRPDSTELLPGVEVPTLILMGEDDAVTIRADAELMERAIPDATLQTIPGAGHLPPMETPDAFNRALVQFLEAARG